MVDSEKTPSKKQCAVCEATSEDRVLLEGEQKGEKINVCVRCLPVLIHGGH